MSATSNETPATDLRVLIGRAVLLTISEPWEFGEVHGNGPFRAQVVDVAAVADVAGGKALLVKLVTPLWFEGNACEHLIATPRSAADDLSKLGGDRSVNCSFVSISPRGA